MKESINYIDNQIDPNIILDYLLITKSLTLKEFSQLTRFFMKYIDETNLSTDEKCLIAIYLAFADVIMPEGKNHSCTGKRKTLQKYYFNNYKDCSNETNQKIAIIYKNYYDKKIIEENDREKRFLEENYPDIYQEIIELRKVKEKKKSKLRKQE